MDIKTGVILRCQLCQNCHVSVCSKFSQQCFCQILFELVYNRESYHKMITVNFLLSQCI